MGGSVYSKKQKTAQTDIMTGLSEQYLSEETLETVIDQAHESVVEATSQVNSLYTTTFFSTASVKGFMPAGPEMQEPVYKKHDKLRKLRLSDKKKKSDQEADALERSGGEYYPIEKQAAGEVLETMRDTAAMSAPVAAFESLTGHEFDVKDGVGIDKDEIVNLCRYYDKYSKVGLSDIPSKREYQERKLETLRDVIDTWFAASGVTRMGKQVSKLDVKEAKKHLPLAIEQYRRFNEDPLFSEGQIACEHLAKQKAAKDRLAEQDDKMRQAGEAAVGKKLALTHADADQLKRMKDMVDSGSTRSHMVRYHSNKELIDRIFLEAAGALQTLSRYEKEKIALTGAAFQGSEFEGEDDDSETLAERMERKKAVDHYLAKRDEAEQRAARMLADAAEAAIEYLLTGKAADVAHGSFIEKRWKISMDDSKISEKKLSDVVLEQAGIDRASLTADEKELSMMELLRNRFRAGDQAYKDRKSFDDKQVYSFSSVASFMTRVQLLHHGVGQTDPSLTFDKVFESAANLCVIKAGYIPEKKVKDASGQVVTVAEKKVIDEDELAQKKIDAFHAEMPKIDQKQSEVEAFVNQHFPNGKYDMTKLGAIAGQCIDVYATAQELHDIVRNLFMTPAMIPYLDKAEVEQVKALYIRARATTEFIRHFTEMLTDADKKMGELDLGEATERTLDKEKKAAEDAFDGFFASETQKAKETVKGEYPFEKTRRLEALDRFVKFDRSLSLLDRLKGAPGFDAVKGDEKVASYAALLGKFQNDILQVKMPAASDGPEALVKQFALAHGQLQSGIKEIRTSTAGLMEYCAGTQEAAYQGILHFAANQYVRLNNLREYAVALQDRILTQVRSMKPGDPALPYYGMSLQDILNNVDMTSYLKVGSETDLKTLGQGGVNTVYRVKGKTPAEDRVLKPGKHSTRFNLTTAASTRGGELLVTEMLQGHKLAPSGIVELDMDTAYRDVGVSMVDKLFGFGAVVGTSFAKSEDGAQASLMEMADGTPATMVKAYCGEQERAGMVLDDQLNAYNMLINFMRSSEKMPDQRMLDQIPLLLSKFVDIGNAESMQSAMNMAALDIIVGHVDRHRGNYFVDDKGRFIGIDNDSSFRQTDKVFESSASADTTDLLDTLLVVPGTETQGKLYYQNTSPAMPVLFFDKAFPCVTKEFRQKILGVSEEMLRGSLSGVVGETELEACVQRTRMLQKYMNEISPDRIVDSLEKEDFVDYASQEVRQKDGYPVPLNYSAQLREKSGDGCEFAFGEKSDEERIRELMEKPNATLKRIIGIYYKKIDDKETTELSASLGLALFKRLKADPKTDVFAMIRDGSMEALVDQAVAERAESGKESHAVKIDTSYIS